MAPSRRGLLASLGAALLVPAGGCALSPGPADDDGEPTPSARSPTPTRTSIPPRSPTPSSNPSAADVLPEPTGGWRLDETRGMDARMLGGETGATGFYTSPDGVRFKVAVLELADRYSPESEARRWACIGWDVGVAHEGFAFAAGAGTERQTFTPETPPHMTRSPVPGTADEARELLSLSPLLSERTVTENRVTCDS